MQNGRNNNVGLNPGFTSWKLVSKISQQHVRGSPLRAMLPRTLFQERRQNSANDKQHEHA